MLMRLPSGEVYEVPDSDERIARSQYGAVPADSVVAGTDSNPMGAAAGGVASGVNALGGLRGLATVGGIGAAGYGAMKGIQKLRGGGQPAPSATPASPPVAPAASAQPPNPAEDRIREAKAAKAEADARAATARADAAEARAKAPEKRTTSPKAPKPPKRTKRPPAKAPDRTTRPPSATQEQHEAMLARKQKGQSKRELAARAKALEVVRGKAPQAPPLGDDMMDQLARSVETEAGMTRLGVERGATLPSGRSLRGSVRSGLKGVPGKLGHPALALLLTLLDAGSMPEQMNQSDALFDEIDPERARLRERLRPQVY